MSSLDLLSMYLSIELQSFALYILATLNKERLSATSAGLKYFLLGSLSSCFILLGSAIIYSYTGLTQFEAINSLMSIPYFETISIKDITILSSLSPSDAVLLLKPGLIEM
jgi:NADH-ubiquinone oxidoreductase chain 2